MSIFVSLEPWYLPTSSHGIKTQKTNISVGSYCWDSSGMSKILSVLASETVRGQTGNWCFSLLFWCDMTFMNKEV
jgi:hypothetical protein